MKFQCCICGKDIKHTSTNLKLILSYIISKNDVSQELYAHMECFEKSLINKNDLYIKYLT